MTKSYKELAKAKVAENKNIVISKNESKGGYTIAQQLLVTDNNASIPIFLKGAIQINELEGLYELRDAINAAIQKEDR